MPSTQSTSMVEHFADLTDPRRREGKYPLINFVVIGVCAVICGPPHQSARSQRASVCAHQTLQGTITKLHLASTDVGYCSSRTFSGRIILDVSRCVARRQLNRRLHR